ncbi:enoyl-CoA hydratase-related protein [Lentibacillus saliphilus]|uniref:enoyl-CoA hydratase-related protein n=1 Tax=Lentibacillus saliphilus TaxID=2737028 RepID=UPI001C310A76|nr:enoyl-CoA hydratase-related protein [Lentibacillus saliphilus]
MSVVHVENENHITRVTINRPAQLNALNYEVLKILNDTIERLHIDPNVHVVIFTGAGDRAFSAGADLKERKELNEQQVRRNVKLISHVCEGIANLPQPTIAAINGHALGGGFELMLACDFAVTVSAATFGLTETKWGIIPGAGGTQRLPRLIGAMKAKEMILTAQTITAQEAEALGLVLRVVELDQLSSACNTLADSILNNAPIAVRQAKYAIHHGMKTDFTSGLAIEGKAYDITIPTEDRREALEAFSEKRAPEFKGR